MVPPAPARFSTTTCWPSASPSAGATVRAVMSTLPLGGHGTTTRTGREGKSCPWTRHGMKTKRRTRKKVIGSSVGPRAGTLLRLGVSGDLGAQQLVEPPGGIPNRPRPLFPEALLQVDGAGGLR